MHSYMEGLLRCGERCNLVGVPHLKGMLCRSVDPFGGTTVRWWVPPTGWWVHLTGNSAVLLNNVEILLCRVAGLKQHGINTGGRVLENHLFRHPV